MKKRRSGMSFLSVIPILIGAVGIITKNLVRKSLVRKTEVKNQREVHAESNFAQY